LEKQVATARRETTDLQREIQELRAQLGGQQAGQTRLYESHSMNGPQSNGAQPGSYPTYASGMAVDQPRTLPPLINGSVAAMQGVQYTEVRR
jgi:hypothetical protein